jgi:8-oxo-dGTP pyrophosphatase MutT (NUDIX family)
MNLEKYQRHINRLNQWQRDNFKAFFFATQPIGYLKEPIWSHLTSWPEFFDVDDECVYLKGHLNTFETRTQVLDKVTSELLELGILTHRHGEKYPVTHAGRETAIATIDRAAAPFFGLRAYGQHLNGFVRSSSGLKLWIARRASDRRIFPDHLDNMVAGGLPHNLTLVENLYKECLEEASIPKDLVDKAIPVGAVTYCTETPVGLKPDTLYCYDLELPPDFVPHNSDGEVAEFMLMSVEEVAWRVAQSDEFKPNCNLVVIDFLIRHGIINPETPGYLELIQGLHEKI